MEKWQKILAAAGAVAGVAAVGYYLLKEEPAASASAGGEGGLRAKAGGKPKVEEIAKEEVLTILDEIIASQTQMKGYMKDLTKKLLKEPMTFEETYTRVKDVQPKDPLEKYQLSMMDFDQLLDQHQADPAVRERIAKIMGAPSPGSEVSEKVGKITPKKIIDVHKFMLEALEELVTHFSSISGKDSYDMKTVTIAAQAMVGAKVEQKFDITSEDIECAVLMNHATLAADQEFTNINIQIQHTMGKLMGQPFAPS
mmetsp:Transcript_54085/g.128813  ORF Transcript_54085/g.128813 Transcript_54085/m.128813 type:complete len:254 (+) Transcript_54085:91-852(+)|eukprot:CAMPEP_0178419598 /NCGR_PEP_ID=MMETSP0689_2-20121128/25694_1 /TAXON_ID=160604 /ORGANISM="Amphidinium massartii, Strain CS-259" /LENGTH=253 /DNA_ID=CAMNT_0020041043 /DNA_START=88 /DNA_END=849 /DNA_ORIENTATION=+